jgi:hypothetical protein
MCDQFVKEGVHCTLYFTAQFNSVSQRVSYYKIIIGYVVFVLPILGGGKFW